MAHQQRTQGNAECTGDLKVRLVGEVVVGVAVVVVAFVDERDALWVRVSLLSVNSE